MPKVENPIFFSYKLSCTFPGCGGVQLIDQAMSAGWAIGTAIPHDPSHPEVARCPRCKRHMMKVANEPPPPPPINPIGWTKIPAK